MSSQNLYYKNKLSEMNFVLIVCMRLYVQDKKISVILVRLPGFNQYLAMGMK